MTIGNWYTLTRSKCISIAIVLSTGIEIVPDINVRDCCRSVPIEMVHENRENVVNAADVSVLAHITFGYGFSDIISVL